MNKLFVSIDIETTGLDPNTCDIIEIGAVIDDWLEPLDSPPKFHTYVKKDLYKGQPYAFSMHPKILRRIALEEEGYSYLYPREAVKVLAAWLQSNGIEGSFTVAGKNFAMFDDRFLKLLPNFDSSIHYKHRVIDPAMIYWNPVEDDRLPSTETCMERAGLEGEVYHTALEDAIIVTKLVQIGVRRKLVTL